MRKIFSFIVVALFAVNAMATKVTFDFTNPASLGITPAEVEEGATAGKGADLRGLEIKSGDVTIVFDTLAIEGVKTVNHPFEWTAKDNVTYNLRVYKNNSITVSAANAEDKITCIEFTGGVGTNIEDVTDQKWSGTAANPVTLKVKSDAKTTNINTITVYINENAEEWVPDTLSVTAARKLIADADPLKDKPHYIKGIVSSDNFGKTWPGYAMIWVRDEVNVTDSLEGYKIYKDAKQTQFASASEIGVIVGDTVLLYADGLAMYKNIYETTSGYLAAVLGGSAIRLDITQGVARCDAGESIFELSLTTENGEFVITLDHSNAKAIVGEYSFNEETDVTLAGEALTLTSGKMTIAYNEGYTVNVTLNTADKTYALNGEKLVLGEFPDDKPYVPEPLPEGVKTCAEIYAIGNALEDNATTEDEYRMRGWVISPYDPSADKNGVMQQSAWIADERDSKSGQVKAQYCYFNEQVVKGDYVELAGKVMKYVKNGEVTVEFKNGQMTKLNTTEGFFNATDSVKAVKRVINGQLFIERAGVLYTITGAAL